MSTWFSHRTLTLLAVLALLGTLLLASPAYAAGEGPLVDNPAPTIGQNIGWAAFQGAPTITNGQTDFWVWNDNILSGTTVPGQNVLHIRTTTNGKSHTFTGTVTTGDASNFYQLSTVNGGGTDSATLVGYNQFTFSLATSGNGDGVDVEWSGRWLSLNLFLDGVHRPGHVLYGASAHAAKMLPIVVTAGRAGLLTLSLSTLDGTTNYSKNIADGYFIYRDAQGYHIRVTTKKIGDKVNYGGRIAADTGAISKVSLFQPENDDSFQLTGGNVLNFHFFTDNGKDGLNWSLNSGGLILTLRMRGQIAAPNVWLGSMSPSDPGIPAFTFRLTP